MVRRALERRERFARGLAVGRSGLEVLLVRLEVLPRVTDRVPVGGVPLVAPPAGVVLLLFSLLLGGARDDADDQSAGACVATCRQGNASARADLTRANSAS